jgi:hypothetical protein
MILEGCPLINHDGKIIGTASHKDEEQGFIFNEVEGQFKDYPFAVDPNKLELIIDFTKAELIREQENNAALAARFKGVVEYYRFKSSKS